ncbi:MAG: endonuclease/exonuclease/phosphatase family protein [Chloroflexi bacterium]|nr:endonuclease/exonuclease/phosphatase family protein [Chloroflexota bacterium]
MRILTLNVRAGGGSRVPALADAIVGFDADLAVLTEYRAGASGALLLSSLAHAGYQHVTHSDPPARTNSVVVVSRRPTEHEPLSAPHHRMVSLCVGGISLLGLYLPLNRLKVEFWDAHLAGAIDSLRGRPSILIGDFNTGAADERQSRVRYFAEDRYEALLRGGWVDPVRRVAGIPPEFTWFSHVGNGFTLDHALVSSDLASRVRSAAVAHRPRLTGITDHSAVVLEVAPTEEG